MTPLSLKWRLSIPIALAVAIAMGLICAFAYDNFRELVLSQTDRSLVSAGKAIQTIMDDPALAAERPARVRLVLAAAADQPRKGHPPKDKEQLRLMARVWLEPSGEDALAIGSPDGLRALNDRLEALAKPPEGQWAHFDMHTPWGSFRGIWMRVNLKDGPGNIVVAQSTAALYGELHELLWSIVLTGIGVVAVVIALSGVLIAFGLRPIRRTAQRLSGVTAGNLGQLDWSSRSVPPELASFVDTVAQMLNRLHEAMRQQKTFIADASHELRTPVAVAKSTLQVALAADRSGTEYRQALEEATDDLRRLEHLVEELLTLARLEESHSLAQPQEVDLSQRLSDLAESFQPRISAAGGRLICDVKPIRVSGDSLQLQRLFSNLLDNALRHGPAGGEIRVTVSEDEILVQDQGGRISPKDLPRLFDRFYRADGSRSHATGGTGLGLAIAKAIALRHGGDIRIESSPATGTCVHVRLPILQSRQTKG